MAATPTTIRPTTLAAAPATPVATRSEAVTETAPVRVERRPSHAARRVATALRGANGRLTVVCPA